MSLFHVTNHHKKYTTVIIFASKVRDACIPHTSAFSVKLQTTKMAIQNTKTCPNFESINCQTYNLYPAHVQSVFFYFYKTLFSTLTKKSNIGGSMPARSRGESGRVGVFVFMWVCFASNLSQMFSLNSRKPPKPTRLQGSLPSHLPTLDLTWHHTHQVTFMQPISLKQAWKWADSCLQKIPW